MCGEEEGGMVEIIDKVARDTWESDMGIQT